MDVTIGSGRSRKTVTVPSVAAARGSQALRVELDRAIDAVKNYLFRPALLGG